MQLIDFREAYDLRILKALGALITRIVCGIERTSS